MLCQVVYTVRSVRVCDIFELSLVYSFFDMQIIWPAFQRPQVRFYQVVRHIFQLARCGCKLRVTTLTTDVILFSGRDLKGVQFAMDFLEKNQKKQLGKMGWSIY